MARHWIVVTRDNLAVVADGAEPRLVTHFPLARVQKFRTQGAIGSGFLQAYVDDAWVDVARYSNTLATRFHKLAGKLEDLRTNGEVEVDPDRAGRLDPLPEVRPEAADGRRTLPALPAAQGDRRPALAAAATAVAGGPGHVRPDARRRGDGARPAEAAAVPGRRHPHQGRSGARCALAAGGAAARRAGAGGHARAAGRRELAQGPAGDTVGVALTFDLRAQLVQKLHALGVGYYDRHQVGSLVSRVAYDSEVLHSLLQQITGGFLLQIVQVVAVGVMLFTLNPKLALFTLIPAPLVVAGSLFFWRRVYPNYYRYWDSSSKQAGMLSGMLSGIRVVKAFAQEAREFDRFSRIQRLPAHARA